MTNRSLADSIWEQNDELRPIKSTDPVMRYGMTKILVELRMSKHPVYISRLDYLAYQGSGRDYHYLADLGLIKISDVDHRGDQNVVILVLSSIGQEATDTLIMPNWSKYYGLKIADEVLCWILIVYILFVLILSALIGVMITTSTLVQIPVMILNRSKLIWAVILIGLLISWIGTLLARQSGYQHTDQMRFLQLIKGKIPFKNDRFQRAIRHVFR